MPNTGGFRNFLGLAHRTPIHASVFLIVALWVILLSGRAYAADYYWVGGSGNWSDINHWATTSGGTVTHFTVPSPTDDVYFDANSFTAEGQTVVMNLNIITCHHFDCTQALYNPTFLSNSATKVEIYGSMLLTKNVNFLVNSNLHFVATSPGMQVQTTGHEMLGNIYFNGSGGGWILMDSLNATGSEIHLREGNLNTNGQEIRCYQFNANYLLPRSLTLGNSHILAYNYWTVHKTGLTLNAGTSTITLTAPSANFLSIGTGSSTYHKLYFHSGAGTATLDAGSISFDRVEFRSNGNISGNVTYGDLVLTKGKTYNFTQASTHIFIDSLLAAGHCMNPIRIQCVNGTSSFIKTSGSIQVESAEIKGIQASGGATFYALACSDLGNNSGWLFSPPPPRTLYWVNGTGLWNDTSNWSVSSGGPSGACPPTQYDDVIFDGNSFVNSTDSVILNASHSYCRDMTWIAFGDDPSLVSGGGDFLHIHGSLHFQPIMKYAFTGPVYFAASTPGQTITSAGHRFLNFVEFIGDGGGWTLLDSLSIYNNNLILSHGHLNTNGKTVSCYRFVSTEFNQRILSLGASKIFVNRNKGDAIEINGSNLSLNAGTSEFILTSSEPVFRIESGAALVFHNILYQNDQGRGDLKKQGSTFNRIKFNADGWIEGNTFMDSLCLSKGRTYTFQKFMVQTINHLIAQGNCNNPVLLETDSAGGVAFFNGGPDTSKIYDAIIQDINCLAGSHFYAYNTVDLGNTTGWNIQSRPALDLYWVNGQGDWADSSHWSVSSGGVPGACIPSPLDNVFFDANSFIGKTDTVFTSHARIMCHDMTWIDNTGRHVFYAGIGGNCRIYGSLLFSDSMYNAYGGAFIFLSDTTGETITSNGKVFHNDVRFRHALGGWTVTDDFVISGAMSKLELVLGSLSMPGLNITIPSFSSSHKTNKFLDIRGSDITLNFGNWNLVSDSTELLADSSMIRFTTSYGMMRNTGGDTLSFHNVWFSESGGYNDLTSLQVTCRFNLVSFAGNANINGNNIFDTLFLSPGNTYKLEAGKQQRLSIMEANGNCFNTISLSSNAIPQQAVIAKSSDTLQITYASLNGINGQGGAVFHAINSIDKGHNSNWIIDATPHNDLYWVNGSGNWHDSTHWSYISGGAGGSCIPTSRDDVFFDANSFTGSGDTVYINAIAECRSMDWTGATGSPMIHGNWGINLYGSLILIDSMNNNLMNFWRFKSDSMSNIIQTAGNVFPRSLVFDGNGTWLLADSLSTDMDIHFMKGNLHTQGNFVSCYVFDSDYDNTRSLTLGNSHVELRSGAQYSWVMNGSNMTLDPGTSTIRFLQATGMFNRTGNNLGYHKVEFVNPSGTSLIRTLQMNCRFNHLSIHNDGRIFGKNTFDSLTFFPDNTYQLDINNPQTIVDYFWVRGNNCFPLRLESTSLGNQATIIKDTGLVTGDFIHMRDIHATGGATFYAGSNSADIANNAGWVFNNAPSYVYGLPDDTFLIKGTPLVINTVNFNGGPGTSYLWGDGSINSSITVNSPGVYYVTVTYDTNCSVSDSIIVFCRLGLDLIPTNATCNAYTDGAIDLNVAGTPAIYDFLWSTGDSTEDITGLGAGWYVVTVSDSVCYGIDSVEITEPPLPDPGIRDTVFCSDTSITIHADGGFTSYQWSNGSSSPFITVSQSDSIWIIVVDSAGCISPRIEIYITADPVPQPNLGTDTCVSFDGMLNLQAGVFEEYQWWDGSTLAGAIVNDTGYFWIRVKELSCYGYDTIYIASCPPEITIPNVFTPNYDGINDAFQPTHQNIIYYHLSIFNRWGQLLFESFDIREGWDGKFQGQECSEGTYFYKIEYAGFGQGSLKHSSHGSITLLR
ncbi:MAG: gliding motility-associated C-terminal domain-containing protein [Lentimicrobiaceae bacterium]|nr:gliding motility-associated C-terminal domain-containing protein [Lentimicrobiaceae bacterium]